jgi:hypothetical protein
VSALPIMLSGSTRRIECCRLQKLILFTQWNTMFYTKGKKPSMCDCQEDTTKYYTSI